jgi:predicted transcriptional regulator
MRDREDEGRRERDVLRVPDEHRAAVLEGFAQAERGEFASDKEMAALWKRCGL